MSTESRGLRDARASNTRASVAWWLGLTTWAAPGMLAAELPSLHARMKAPGREQHGGAVAVRLLAVFYGVDVRRPTFPGGKRGCDFHHVRPVGKMLDKAIREDGAMEVHKVRERAGPMHFCDAR